MARRSRLLAAAAGMALLGAACGGSSGPSAVTLLQRAKAKFDQTSAFHLEITSSNASGNGLVLKSASGDAARPSKFQGTLTVEESNLPVQIGVVSVGGTSYVRLPFSGAYIAANPAQYGFANPGKLLDPNTGISTLLPATQSPKLGSTTRYSGESLQEVSGTLPGRKVKQVLLDANPSQPVSVVYSIDTSNNEVRLVDLTGPLFQSGQDATFHLILTNYGESVSITPPPG
jgi:hypothetical protein